MQRQRIAIVNGFLVNPAEGGTRRGDLFIAGGRIVSEEQFGSSTPDFYCDATGKYVTPGLIDFHAHVSAGGSQIGIPTDLAFLPQGVTAVVDAGSAGVDNIEDFLKNVVQHSLMPVYCYLNLSPEGLTTLRHNENLDPKYWDEAALAYYLEQYPRYIKGLKLRISRDIVGNKGYEIYRAAVELARRLGTHLVVHVTDPPAPMADILALLSEGDVVAHCYHGTGQTILDSRGNVCRAAYAARQRGVILDTACGRINWDAVVTRKALSAGLRPDIISTDITSFSLYKESVWGLPLVLSKYIALGMFLDEAIACATVRSAKVLGLENELGTLSIGSRANVAVFDYREQEMEFADINGHEETLNKVLVPKLTVLAGTVVYRTM